MLNKWKKISQRIIFWWKRFLILPLSVPLHVVILYVSNSELSPLIFSDVQIKNVLSVISCYFFITCMFVRSVIGNCSNIWKEFLHENISLLNISKQFKKSFIYSNVSLFGHEQQVYKITKVVHFSFRFAIFF